MDMSDDAAQFENVAHSVRAALCGPGGQFETAAESVLGEQMLVFANRHRSVGAFLDDVCERFGTNEFLVLGNVRLTYAEVHERVDAIAGRLVSRGVGRGDRVAILAANRPEWVLTFLATVRIGGIVAALNGWGTAAELDHALTLSEPSLVVGDTRRLARASGFPPGVEVIDMDAEPDFFAPSVGAVAPDVPIDEDDPALILFTSGTTGRAKGALISHRSIVGFVDGTLHNAAEKKRVALEFLGIDPATVPDQPQIVLNTSPLFHLSGLFAGVLMPAGEGNTVVFREGRFDPADVLRLIEEERITSWTAIGSMGPSVMAHPDLAARDTSSLTRMSSGGAHLSEHMQQLIRTHFPQAAAAIGQGYGSSESVGVVTSIGGQAFADDPAAAGTPCLGFDIEIRDTDGEPVADGEDGEVHVRSPYSMLEYWRNPEATAATIKPGRWLAMGDVGRLENGVLYLNSRARDMIIRSGENIYPIEIENRIEAHPDVAEVAVIGVDHVDLGQEVKAVVVPAGDAFDPAALASWCAEELAGYKVPTHWERRAEPLPRNAAGKVVKDAITGDRELSTYDD